MKNNKTLEFESLYNNMYYYYDIKSIICLLFLRHNNVITKSQLYTYYKNHKNETALLDRIVNTYFCKINKKWYNETFFYDILLELVNTKCDKLEMSPNEMVGYISEMFPNMKYNHAINYFALELINKYSDYFKNKLVHKILNVKYIEFDDIHGLGYGYCCEDCSGDYEEYKKMQYENYHKPKYSNVKNDYLSFLNSMKKGKGGYYCYHLETKL